MSRGATAVVILAVLGGLSLGMIAVLAAGSTATPAAGSGGGAALGSGPSSAAPDTSSVPGGPVEPSASAIPPAGPSPSPAPSMDPSPSLVRAPLTGQLVSPAAASRHPLAVMVDDLGPARPQSGFNAASIVWQAPAEGGIPRYMMVFQETVPADVGPVRSARDYYVAWAAELRALYVHAGGSPQALATLRDRGQGQLVFDADEFRWGGSFRRVATRLPPHNLYTTGPQLRELVAATGATDVAIAWPWTFAPDAPIGQRPVGGRIEVSYLANVIRYDYDRASNSYLRSVTGEKAQVDAATRQRVGPRNVIVMVMHFGPLNDGQPQKGRLVATVVGSGPAWISTNGVTQAGTWRKTSLTAPTQFLDDAARPVTLTVGQTFVQVMQTTDPVSFIAGTPAPPLPLPGGLNPR
ncbi:MAG: hypothetical protein NVS9B8_02830 [Candidatus Limnocylindrales bacterium]